MEELRIIKECEKELEDMFDYLDDVAYLNQKKVLKAFQNKNISLRNFYGSTGYAYDDSGQHSISYRCITEYF